MDGTPTPTTATSQFIQAGSPNFRSSCGLWKLMLGFLDDDDDDIDESAIPAFSHPTMRPSTPPLNKGKSRAPEQLALPAGSAPSNQLSGNIGTPIGSASRGTRRDIGGVQVESRSRIRVHPAPRRETYPSLGPAGLLLLTNQSPPPLSVSFPALSTCMLTVS